MSRFHLRSIRLAPFGNHRDTELVLGEPGTLTVVYGANGAGKSTLRRAVHHLLYGIPQGRLNDDYRHPRKELRIEALVEIDGERRHVARVAGAKNSLRDAAAADAVIPPEWLAQLLAIERDTYTSRFCLDHPGLRAGGDELLRAPPGEVASLGLATLKSLRALEHRLGGDAAGLFKPNASKPPLNAALARYRELDKQLKQASLAARDWRAAERRVEELQRTLDAQNGRYAELRIALERTARIKNARPLLAEYRELQSQLRELEAVPDLTEDFPQRRLQLLETRQRVEAERGYDRELLERRQAERARLRLQPEVLTRAEAIEACLEGRGAYRQALRALPSAEAALDQALVSCRDTARRAGLAPDVEPPPLAEAQLERLKSLAARRQALVESADEARAAAVRAEDELRRVQQITLPEPPPTEVRQLLEAALRASAGIAADVDNLTAAETGLRRAEDKLTQALTRLKPALDSRMLAAARVPPSELIADYRGRFEAQRHAEADARREREELERALHDNTRSREALCEAGVPPSLEDLRRARAARDTYWRRLRRVLGAAVAADDPDGAPVAEPPAAEQFERLVEQADGVADRRYQEVDRVQQLAQLERDARRLEDRLRQLREREARLVRDRAQLEQEWRGDWGEAGIAEPGRPTEMLGWRQDYERALHLRDELEQARANLQRCQARVETGRATMLKALQSAGVSVAGDQAAGELRLRLEAARAAAEECAERFRRHQDSLAAAADAQGRAAGASSLAERRLAEWRQDWRDCLVGLGLAPGASVEQALAQLKALDAAASARAERARAEAETTRLRRVRDDFEREVAALAAAVPSEASAAAEVDARVEALKRALESAKSAERDRVRLDAEIAATERRIIEHDDALRGLAARERALLAEAGADTLAALAELEQRAKDKRRCRERAERLREQLFEVGDGLTPEQLQAAAARDSGEGLSERLEALRRDQEALDAARAESQRELALAQRALEELRHGQAEPLAQQRDAALLRVRELAERYAVRSVAAGLVRRAIEHYAEAYQDPLLARASQHLATVTDGAFEALRADYGEHDEVVHLALRADGARVPVASLSDGERDAVYLALYVAALEQQLDAGVVLPVVFDDVLINVDDPRCEPLLRLLQTLARRTQVLLFTHHQRVAELARERAGARVCHLADQGGRPAAA